MAPWSESTSGSDALLHPKAVKAVREVATSKAERRESFMVTRELQGACRSRRNAAQLLFSTNTSARADATWNRDPRLIESRHEIGPLRRKDERFREPLVASSLGYCRAVGWPPDVRQWPWTPGGAREVLVRKTKPLCRGP